MTAALPSSTGDVWRGRIVATTPRALLLFVPTADSAIGSAAWFPLVAVFRRQILSESNQVEIHVVDGFVPEWRRGYLTDGGTTFRSVNGAPTVPTSRDLDDERARALESERARLRGSASRPGPFSPPEPVMPQIGRRPASFSQALASATIERTSPGGASLEELLARFPQGVLVVSGPDGATAAAVVERGPGGVRTTEPIAGATVLEALEALDAQRAEHERARREHRSRVTGGGRR